MIAVVGGTLIVTPVPKIPHQRVVGRLIVVLSQAAPDEYEVLPDSADRPV